MEVVIKRGLDNKKCTVGFLSIEGRPYCVTLENTYGYKQKDGKSRIPAARYEVKLQFDSPLAVDYNQKYGTKGLICLQNVEDFTDISIKIGSTEKDTGACICVATLIQQEPINGKIEQRIVNSTAIYKRIHSLIVEALAGEQVFITVLD